MSFSRKRSSRETATARSIWSLLPCKFGIRRACASACWHPLQTPTLASPTGPRMAHHAEPPPSDPVGAATLEQLAEAGRYNRWMFERLQPWIGRRVLEVGSGIGNLSAFLLDRDRLVLTDTRPE